MSHKKAVQTKVYINVGLAIHTNAYFYWNLIFNLLINFSIWSKNFIALIESLLTFHDFPGTKPKFHDFPGLENEILKFYDFPGFISTLVLQ